MEIEKKNIKELRKILSKVPYEITSRVKSTIFFPIESGADITESTNDLFLTDKKEFKNSGLIKPGLGFSNTNSEKNKITFLYAGLDYAKEFSIRDYLSIVDHKLSKKDIEKLMAYTCYFVPESYIYAEFKLEKEKEEK